MQVPGWLLTLIGRCLEKQPEGRYSDGRELHEAIAQSSVAEIKTEIAKEIKAEIPLAQSNAGDGKMIISSLVVAILVIMLLFSLAYNTYTLLSKNRPVEKAIPHTVPDSIVKPDSSPPITPEKENTDYQNKGKQADSATQSTIQDVIRSEQNKAGNTDSTNTDTTKNNQN